MQTKVAKTATGYTVSFHEEHDGPAYITFECDYAERKPWGLSAMLRVQSPLMVQSALPDGTAFITHMNLMSSRDRRDAAMRLGVKIAAPASGRAQDWEAHLEQVAGLVSYEMNKPSPTMRLEDAELPEGQRFLIPGLLATNKTNVIFGPGGTGKSILATRIAASVVSGQPLFGMPVNEPGEVVYLDWEDDAETMVHRLESVCAGMGISRVPFAYKSMAEKGAYERQHADLRHYLTEHPTALVIFDSTAMAMNGSSGGDGADGSIRFFSLLSQLKSTRLLIDHVSSDDVKQDEKKGPPKKPYGSVFKGNSARNMWSVWPWNESRLSGLTLSHAKSNVGPRQQDIDVSVEWRDGNVNFSSL